MTDARLPRTATAVCLFLAPVAGVVAAAVTPALTQSTSAEIAAIAAHQRAFYVYAISILISSYLLVPAFFGVLAVLRGRTSRWTLAGGLLTLTGVVIAIGDAATELLFWQMGAPGADSAQMVALAQRYEDAPGASLVYAVGGLSSLIGIALVAVALWRTRAVPRWAAVALVLAAVAQVLGFDLASKPVLLGSYVVLLAAFAPVAVVLLRRPDETGVAVAAPGETVPAA